jgi:hypothetical protein
MAEKRANVPLQWAVFGALVAVELGLVGRLLTGASEVGLLVAGITAVAALLVLTIRVFDLGSLSVGKGGIRAELNAVKERIDEADRRIDELFLLTMSPAMFLNLKKLASRRFGPYEMGPGLERELRHLRDIGYIEVQAIGSLPRDGGELSEFVKVTPAGERFVALREQLEREPKAEGGPA